MASQTKGYCKYCGKEYTKAGMLRHLTACKERNAGAVAPAEKTQCGYFQVVISGKYVKYYWLIIEISENATLKELDRFLRDIWLECCGHLSAFDIGGVRYAICPDTDSFWGSPEKSMNYKLKTVFTVGQTAAYEYDYGSTTDLILNVHSYCMGKKKREKITILSRNNPLEILCSKCGKNKAQWVNPVGIYSDNPFWCEDCLRENSIEDDGADEYEYEEYEIPEFFLPICNSPRMGVCGYEGSDVYPDQFQPDGK